MLDKVKATHGHEPVDASAGRLLKRPRPAFLSQGGTETTSRFQARPAARPAGSGSSAAVAAAAAAAAAGGTDGSRKRPRDGKGLAFGAGLMSRGVAAAANGLPKTLAAMMELASKDPARFSKVIGRCGRGFQYGGCP